MRVTVCLTATADGKKLLPYVLVNRKRLIPKIAEEFKDKLIINWHGSTWMDDSTTEDYLRKVIKGGGVFDEKRLLVWDAFAAHKSVKTTAVLKELGLMATYIPGGCTKFIQAPDVSWNKPFKRHVRDCYTTWMSNDSEKEYTPAGNPRAPSLHLVMRWIDCAWKKISKETIVKSFEACAITTPTDGSGDFSISCFKSSGSIGIKRLDLLRKIRAQQQARDGRFDFEDAGIEEDENTNLENFNDYEPLLFEH